MPNYTQFKIIGLEYSGSTILDILISNIVKPPICSLGEIERTIENHLKIKNKYNCSCGDIDCIYWQGNFTNYEKYTAHIRKVSKIVDSSKTISSLKRNCDYETVIIFVFRDCSSWSWSVLKRFFKVEVKTIKLKNIKKNILPFIRIEILRRLLIPIPLEWLYRNILLLIESLKQAKINKCKIIILPFDSIISEFKSKSLSTKYVHMQRGNRTKNKKKQKINSLKKNIKILFVFDIILNLLFLIFNLKKEKNFENSLINF